MWCVTRDILVKSRKKPIGGIAADARIHERMDTSVGLRDGLNSEPVKPVQARMRRSVFEEPKATNRVRGSSGDAR